MTTRPKEISYKRLPTTKLRDIVTSLGIPWKCSRCGSEIETDLIVHHTNCNPSNNTKENLQVVCRNCHRILHGKKIFLNKKDRCTNVCVSIPLSMLNAVEQNIEGLNRSKKIVTCIETGYTQLVSNGGKTEQ